MLEQPIACIDVETTGTSPQHDRITEIGVVEIDPDGSVREWSTLVNPGVPIPPFIQNLTGISDVMVATAPAFAEIAGELQQRLTGRLFVAHNVRFDYGFVRNEFKRADIAFRADTLCTVRLSRRLYPQHYKHNLDSLIERLGLVIEDRHRALSDARVLSIFLRRLRDEHPAEAIDEAVRHVMAKPVLPAHIPEGLLDDIPDSPGVYLFYGEEETPLLVGKSNGLRSRVLGYFAGEKRSAKEQRIAQQIQRIEWRETAGELGALLLEANLIRELHPLHNAVPKKQVESCSWRMVRAANGGMTLELTAMDTLALGCDENLYGLFPSPPKAVQALRELAEAHRLCLRQIGLEKPSPSERACSSHSTKKCRGLCAGKEDIARHDFRLMEALVRLRIADWPYLGPVSIKESYGGREEMIVLDGWRYLGTVRHESEIPLLLASRAPAPFDPDIYRLLAKHLHQLYVVPLVTFGNLADNT
jgi:DNA polymerase-3 subunit epsilon